jgi:AP-1-like factor
LKESPLAVEITDTMTSTRNPLESFFLTPQQQSLLYAALNSNQQPLNSASAQSLDGLKDGQLSGFDYDFGAADSSFDFSFDDSNAGKIDEDSPAKSDSPESDSPDKRSHPDDDDEEETGAKRRESEDKVAKKPGRKPLTTEPTTVSYDFQPSTTWNIS